MRAGQSGTQPLSKHICITALADEIKKKEKNNSYKKIQ